MAPSSQSLEPPQFPGRFKKEYAKANDEALGDLLVDLLVDRTKQEGRNLLQLVLTQSLITAPKLTAGQIATLTIVFILRHTQNNSGTYDGLRDFLVANVQPFIEAAGTSTASFGQLEFAGCGKDSMSSMTLDDIFQQNYAGLFRKGFDEQRLNELQIPFIQFPWAYARCLNDNSKLQIRALNQEQLKEKLDSVAVAPEVRTKFENLFNEGKMTNEEVRAKVLEFAPFMEQLFVMWNSTGLRTFLLTSVGMAIGHANAKRITGIDVAPLSIWIN